MNAAVAGHPVVAHEEWLTARVRLLGKEKQLTRLRDELAVERRALPWTRVEKDYRFTAPQGVVSLADLFEGRSQLFVKHFMLAPGQKTLCVGCALEVDHLQGILVHLENHDVKYVAVARAPVQEIEAVRQRMGWTFRWVSSCDSDFNYDFNVSFTDANRAAQRARYNYRDADPGIADLSGDSVFFKDPSGQIFHTYSTFGRGGEEFLGIYRFLDAVPRGRQEHGPSFSLPDWVRLHNTYGEGGTVEVNGRYHAPQCECAAHAPPR